MVLGLATWPICAGIFAVCLWLGGSWQMAFYVSLPVGAVGMCSCLLWASVRPRSFWGETAFCLAALLAWALAGALCFGTLRLLLNLR